MFKAGKSGNKAGRPKRTPKEQAERDMERSLADLRKIAGDRKLPATARVSALREFLAHTVGRPGMAPPPAAGGSGPTLPPIDEKNPLVVMIATVILNAMAANGGRVPRDMGGFASGGVDWKAVDHETLDLMRRLAWIGGEALREVRSSLEVPEPPFDCESAP